MSHYIRLLLSLMASIFLVFGNTAHADSVQRSHLIIVADHRGSMGEEDNHIGVQTEAITNALADYTEDCSHTTVTYIPWAETTLSAVSVEINDAAARHFLISRVLYFSTITVGGTDHIEAYETAKTFVRDDDITVMVFLTDGWGRDTYTDSPAFKLYKIAVDDSMALGYLTKSFVAESGTVYGPKDATELEAVIKQVLGDTKTALCLG